MTEHVAERQERQEFDRELGAIEAKVIELFTTVAEDVPQATDALLSGNSDAVQALTGRDLVIDALYPRIEELADREILLQQPVAADLRLLISVLRVVPELERCGDLAAHIASRAATGMAMRLTPVVRGLLEEMATICSGMWRRAADAWAERDGDVAAELDKIDDQLDTLHETLVAELERADLALRDALQMTLVGRFYERLGDHAVHISERVRYLATGT